MKRTIKLLFLLTALLLCAVLLGGAALAEEDPPRSGSINDTINWEIDGEGTLHITGTGAISYYSVSYKWKNLRDEIKKAVFSEGLEDIGSDTLVECHNLEVVELPSTLTSINSLALRDTPALREINVAAGCEKYFSHEGVLYQVRDGNTDK